jgi:hypothetical protein
MDHTAEPNLQSYPVSTPLETRTTQHLSTLALALIFGGVVVWQLRQDWAKDQIWPWLFLLVTMFSAAAALRELNLWLPGQPILPRLEKVSTQTFTLVGAVCIALAMAIAWFVVQKLLPDYRTSWPGTPQLWLVSMISARRDRFHALERFPAQPVAGSRCICFDLGFSNLSANVSLQ